MTKEDVLVTLHCLAGRHVRVTGLSGRPLSGPGPRHSSQGGTAGDQPWSVSQVLDATRHCGHFGVSSETSGQS